MADFKKLIPQKHKNASILGMFGGAVGGGIGGYFSALNHNYVYSGIGALIGYVVAILFALIYWKKINTNLLLKTKRVFYFFLCLIGLFEIVASLIVFVRTRDRIAVLGLIFFGLGDVYLISKMRS